MKVIIDINEETYADAIHDSEYDTLQLGITLKEIVKNGTPLKDELEKIKAELIGKCNHCNCVSCVFVSLKDEKCFMKVIINENISELKGENNDK